MPEIICDTSPIQYLYQLKLFHILPALAQRVIVPPAVVDELAAGRVAKTLGLCLTGTLGLLLDAKRAGLIPKVSPILDQLEALRFRLALHTRAAVLKLAGEVDNDDD